MDLRRLPAEEAAVRRFIEALWLPFIRDLAGMRDDFALAEDVDVVAEELEFRLERLDSEGYRHWVAVEDSTGGPLADDDGALVGFVATDVDEPSPVFDRPDRLVISDIYVRESARGTGLADRLMARARERAREVGCEQLRLDVDVANERALAFYERCGFEPHRYEMVAPVSE